MAVAYKGSISMRMLLIPIGLYKTTVKNDIHFNQLEKESKARIRYKKYCSHCGKEVASKDIIKVYEYEKDYYAVPETGADDKPHSGGIPKWGTGLCGNCFMGRQEGDFEGIGKRELPVPKP